MSDFNNDMRTPLGKVRGLGSAKEGTGHFWYQRLSAVALVPLALFFIGLVISLHGASYAEARAALSHPFTAIVMALFVVSGVYHMRLGMQVVIEDYVHGEGMKRLRHPEIGLIELEFSVFAVDGRPELGMIVYNPAKPSDAELIRSLIAARAAK